MKDHTRCDVVRGPSKYAVCEGCKDSSFVAPITATVTYSTAAQEAFIKVLCSPCTLDILAKFAKDFPEIPFSYEGKPYAPVAD